jgi:tetratricopeptide (TPR) repeat protein
MGIEAALHILGWRDDQRNVIAKLDQLVGSTGSPGAVDLALRKADLAADLGDYETAVVEARKAAETARSIGGRSRLAAALIAGARHEWRSTHDAAVTEQLDEAIEIAVADDDAATEADARLAYGVIASEQDRYDDAAAHIRMGLERAREAGDRRLEGWALNSFGLMRLNSGDLDGARQAFNASLEVRREIGHRLGETGVMVNLAMLDEIEGHYVDAVVANQRAIVLSEEIGDQYNLGWSLNNLGLLWAMLGRTDEAKRVSLETLRVGREIGEASIEANAQSNLSLLEHQLGNDVEALERARAALRIAETAQAAGLIAETLTNQGHALVALGDLSGAESSYRHAIEIRNELGDLTGVTEPMAGMARIDLQRGDVAAALRSVEPILDVISSSSLEGTYEPFRIYLTCVEVLSAAGDPRSHGLLVEARGELMARAEGIDDVELRSSFLDGVPSHRALLESSS